MKRLISFEEEGNAKIKMEGIDTFFHEVLVKLNCYYDHATKSFSPPLIKFEFISPVDAKVLEKIAGKCNKGKQFRIIISKPKEYPKILEGCILDHKNNLEGTATSLIKKRT
jgi:hypothetical protein